MAGVVVGVDIGTTSTKAVAFRPSTEAVASASAAYALQAPAPDRAEQDPDVVAKAAMRATAECAGQVRDSGDEVVGVSFSAAMHSLIGVDGEGKPLTPLVTWADGRAEEQARRLRREPRGLALQRRTGTPIHPMAPLVKLRWFADHEPELAGRVQRWLGIKEYLLGQLGGDPVVDAGIASGTGLYDLTGERWDDEALDYAGIRGEQLPQPVPTTTELSLPDSATRRLGLPQGARAVIGGADGPLANLGLGAVRPGAVACSIGTSGAVRAAADRPHVDERGAVFCYNLAPERWVVGGAVNNGGVVLDWLRDAVAPDLADRHPRALLELAAEAPAGSGGLLFLPHLLGERAPHWSSLPRGAWIGLRREHQRRHLVRSAVEGVCLQLATVLASLRAAGVEVVDVRATGGFSRSALWRRILVDVFDRPVGFAASPEGSGLGAALLGMRTLGMIDSLDQAADLVETASVEHPDRADAATYARLLPVFERAYERLEPVFGDLHDMQA